MNLPVVLLQLRYIFKSKRSTRYSEEYMKKNTKWIFILEQAKPSSCSVLGPNFTPNVGEFITRHGLLKYSSSIQYTIREVLHLNVFLEKSLFVWQAKLEHPVKLIERDDSRKAKTHPHLHSFKKQTLLDQIKVLIRRNADELTVTTYNYCTVIEEFFSSYILLKLNFRIILCRFYLIAAPSRGAMP